MTKLTKPVRREVQAYKCRICGISIPSQIKGWGWMCRYCMCLCQKKYREENKEKLKESILRCKMLNYEKYKAQKHKHYLKHREEILSKKKHEYQENILIMRLKRKQHRKQLRELVLLAYGGNPPKCACCSENRNEFLTIDHINGSGRKHRRELGASEFYPWLKRNHFPSGYRVLCYNCNCSIGLFGYCPHQKNTTAFALAVRAKN